MSYNTIVKNNSTGWNLSSVTSYSASFTVGATGSDKILLAILCTRSAEGTSITYGTYSLTLAKRTTYDTCCAEIWYLKNPPSGTYTLRANMSAGNDRAILAAISFYNVDQSNPINRTAGQGASVGTFATACTAVGINNCVAVDAWYHASDPMSSPYSGQTIIKTRDTGDTCGSSYELDIDTTSETMGWSGASSDALAHAIVVLNPSECDEVSKSETASVDESTGILPDGKIGVEDSISISETTKLTKELFVSTSDSVTITDSRQDGSVYTPSTTRTVSVWEKLIVVTTTPNFPGTRDRFIFENVSIGENLTVKIYKDESTSHKPYFNAGSKKPAVQGDYKVTRKPAFKVEYK